MSVWRTISTASARLANRPRRLGAAFAGQTRDRTLRHAERLAAEGRLLEAIRYATERNRVWRDPMLEQRLVQWRHDAFDSIDTSNQRADWPPAIEDPFPGLQGLPEIQVGQLTVEALGGGILHHGCLIVRGLLNSDEADCFVGNFDRSFDARDAARAGARVEETTPWYVPFPMGSDMDREFVYPDGIFGADSPRNFFDLIDLFERKRIVQVISEYLGERPALSVKKLTIRKVPFSTGTSWHQDGAFLGDVTRTVNVWVALSRCGVDAPGLEIVPLRIPSIVQTGSHGSCFDWDVGDGMVKLVSNGTPAISPVFAPGDAVLFDHLLLHRTGVKPGMTKDRYAIESWFFAPSTYPRDRIPLVI